MDLSTPTTFTPFFSPYSRRVSLSSCSTPKKKRRQLPNLSMGGTAPCILHGDVGCFTPRDFSVSPSKRARCNNTEALSQPPPVNRRHDDYIVAPFLLVAATEALVLPSLPDSPRGIRALPRLSKRSPQVFARELFEAKAQSFVPRCA